MFSHHDIVQNCSLKQISLTHNKTPTKHAGLVPSGTPCAFPQVKKQEQVTFIQLYHGENKLHLFSYIMGRTSYIYSAISWGEQVTFI
jgi:hypothetical protein